MGLRSAARARPRGRRTLTARRPDRPPTSPRPAPDRPGVIDRWEGGLFLGAYGAYLLFTTLRATEHDAIHGLSAAMLWFVLPLVILGIGVSVLSAARRHRRSPTDGPDAGARPE